MEKSRNIASLYLNVFSSLSYAPILISRMNKIFSVIEYLLSILYNWAQEIFQNEDCKVLVPTLPRFEVWAGCEGVCLVKQLDFLRILRGLYILFQITWLGQPLSDNVSQCPTNVRQCPTNVSQCPINVRQCPANVSHCRYMIFTPVHYTLLLLDSLTIVEISVRPDGSWLTCARDQGSLW